MKYLEWKRYLLYLFRWQLSTPILAGVLFLCSNISDFSATVIANFIGGIIFFWVDMFIFTSHSLDVQWEVKEISKCVDCGKETRGYRVVKAKNYNRLKQDPEFRCEQCSTKKTQELRDRGIEI